MELIELERNSLSEKAKLAQSDRKLSDRLNKLASLKEQADAISSELLRTHPFVEEVVEFSTLKKKLAHDLAFQVMSNEDLHQIEAFERKFSLALDVVQDVMIAYEERKSAKTSLTDIGKRIPKEATEIAFQSLLKTSEIKGMNTEFQELLVASVGYCIKIILRA